MSTNFIVPAITGQSVFNFGNTFAGLRGLEVGGPSPAWLPTGIYSKPLSLDNLIFSRDTLWSSWGDDNYIFDGKTIPGKVYIDDAISMNAVADKSYDFLFASHVLEHIVNPLRFMDSVSRILKDTSFLLLVLPWKDGTFDHLRPITLFEKLLEIYKQKRSESDCLDIASEALPDYDFSRDPGAIDAAHFLERCGRNLENRAFHVHVYDFPLIYKVAATIGFTPKIAQLVAPYHQVVLFERRILPAYK